jgi:hypothetical protein
MQVYGLNDFCACLPVEALPTPRFHLLLNVCRFSLQKGQTSNGSPLGAGRREHKGSYRSLAVSINRATETAFKDLLLLCVR